MSSKEDCSIYNATFSHVYVEEEAFSYPMTQSILNKLSSSSVIKIKHYKDVFNRSHQSYQRQKLSKKLILAVNHGQLIYKSSPLCQDFGNDRFFYTATAMNCIYDCDYCFLKGMYPSANMVVFVNLEDYADEAAKLGECYLSVSFDTDLQAMNSLTGEADFWTEFARNNPKTSVELRTKSAPSDFVNLPNLIYAFTVTTPAVKETFEKGTAGIRARLESIGKAIESGSYVRLCFDPLIYHSDWKSDVDNLFQLIRESKIDLNRVKDISIGSFRIPADYLKPMRKAVPDSRLLSFPFDKKEDSYSFPDRINEEMINYVKSKLKELCNEGKIYCI